MGVVNMEIKPSMSAVGGYAKALEDVDKDPEVKKLQDAVDTYQAKSNNVDSMISMTPDARKNKAGALYDNIYKEVATRDIHTWGPVAITATMGLATAGLVAANVTGCVNPQIQGLLALGILVGMFNKHCFPTAFAKIMKKFVLPKQVDKKLMQELQKQSTDVHGRLDVAKERLEQTKAAKIDKIYQEEQKREAERSPSANTVEEESEFLVVDGVKLKKRFISDGDIEAAP
jgi:hypothetical protein